MSTKILSGPQPYPPPNWEPGRGQGRARWSLFIDSGVPEGTQQSSGSQWTSGAISSWKCCVMMLPAKLRTQQVNPFRVQDIAIWSHTSCLYYSQCRNTFLAQLYELSSTSLYLNHKNSRKPVLLLSHLTLQLGSNESRQADTDWFITQIWGMSALEWQTKCLTLMTLIYSPHSHQPCE